MASAQVEDAIYSHGDQVLIDFTPGAAVVAGDVQLLDTAMPGIWGVANQAIASGALGAIDIGGIYKLKLGTGEAFTAGDIVEWDISGTDAWSDAHANGDGHIGIAVADAVSGDDYVLTKLNLTQMIV